MLKEGDNTATRKKKQKIKNKASVLNMMIAVHTGIFYAI